MVIIILVPHHIMVLNESHVKEIVKKIDGAVINPTTMHPFDEERLAHLFNNLFT
jgi:hypothetical protein